MEKAFKHPLARKATTAKLRRPKGAEETVLVILTTLELDSSASRFNPKSFGRLQNAADAFLAERGDIAGYSFINRPRDWPG